MQDGRRTLAGALAYALVLAPAWLGACDAQPLPITVHTSEWSPYVTRDDSYRAAFSADGAYGEFADIVTETLREANYEPVYEHRPWSAIEEGLREKRVRCAFPYLQDEDRRAFMAFSASPLGVVREAVFYDNTRRLFCADGVRPGTRLGVIEGYAYSERIRALFPARVTVRTDEREAFEILVEGRPVAGAPIDALLCPESVGERLLALHHPVVAGRFEPIVGLGEDNPLYLVVPRGARDGEVLLQRFDAAFERLRKQGVIDEIRREHATRGRPGSAEPQLESLVEVVLRASATEPIVLGYLAARDEAAVAIPNGTRAVLLEWARPFEHAGRLDLEDPRAMRSEVRLLEGPLRGETVWVPASFVCMR